MITTTLHLIRLKPAFERWLPVAHYLLKQGIEPAEVEWIEVDDDSSATSVPELPPMRFNDTFLKLARLASFHRSPDRWTVMYRVLWRLVHGQSRLLNELLDPDVMRLNGFAREVERDVRHLVATAHFSTVETSRGPVALAWFIPRHHSLVPAAPLLARKMGEQLWSLLTPDGCVHWNGEQLTYSPGEKRIGAGSPGRLEMLWRLYHANRFGLEPEEMITPSRDHKVMETNSAAEWRDLPLFRSR